jgi:hypothetical protein
MYVTSGGSLATSIYNIGDTTFGGSIPLNQWTHIAMVRSSNVITGYINGTAQATTTSTATTVGNTGGFGVGAGKDGSNKFTGYISNARVVNGVAVYTGNFTPSTTPLTAIANTNLLTSQSNRFIDNSTNAYTITTTGSPTINSFDPFVPNSSYSTYGSAYFDGTGDYLSAPSNAALTFGTGDFTVEFWVYLTANAPNFCKFYATGTSANNFTIETQNTTNKLAVTDYTASVFFISSTALSLNTWTHVAVTRSGTAMKLFQNGTQVGSSTNSTNFAGSTALIGSVGSTAFVTGYISDVRTIKGTAVYTTTFTPPATPLTAIENTSLLTLQNNQSVNNNVFLDNSTNNFFVTRYGNATQGTFSPYGANWSNYLNGSSSLSVNVSGVAAGTSTFTFESWIYLNAYPGTDAAFYDTRSSNGASTTGMQFGVYSTGALKFYDGTETNLGGTVPLNQWVHIAFVRNGSNVMTPYINGTATGTTVSSTRNFSDQYFWICSVPGPTSPYINAYLSNLRWVVGTAVYTSNFTPSTTPLTAITNTKILTCQSNRFIDNSANVFTITINGTPTIQRFSPFNPSAEYSTSTIGGSGYFDGSGDYLSAGSNSAFAVGTGDFTFQVWVYPTAYTSPVGAIFDTGSGVGSGRFSVVLYANGILRVDNNTNLLSSSSALPLNQWTFISIIRSSGTMNMYFNGTSVASGSITNNFTETQGIIGKTVDNYYFQGYISNFSLVKGTALANTVPTTPLTAIANTSLLLNYTSGGIIDNSMMNNLETVGNAQISTVQSKFGGSSMYFDGTGDYLVPSAPNSNLNLVLGTGNFTIEFWVYFNSGLGSDIVLYDSRPLTTNGVYPTLYVNSSSQLSYVVSGTDQITSGSAFSATTWYHVALCRSSTSTKMFINGTQVGSTYTDSNNYLNPARRPVIAINGYNETAAPLNGYIDDLRVTKGVARYTTTFTPPTQAFPTY